MHWRRPTFGETWEIALVLLVLCTGVVLLAGLPSASAGRDAGLHTDWACAGVAVGEPACAHHAGAPAREGRAVGRGAAQGLR